MAFFQGKLYYIEKIWPRWGGVILLWLVAYRYRFYFENHRVQRDQPSSCDSSYLFGEDFGSTEGYRPLEQVGKPMGWTPIKLGSSNERTLIWARYLQCPPFAIKGTGNVLTGRLLGAKLLHWLCVGVHRPNIRRLKDTSLGKWHHDGKHPTWLVHCIKCLGKASPLSFMSKILGYPSSLSLCVCSHPCQSRPESLEFCYVVVLLLLTHIFHDGFPLDWWDSLLIKVKNRFL